MSNRPTTIKDIAKALRISISTVSKALNDHPNIGATTKERVLALAKKLDYTPNKTAIQFKQQKTFTLGIIIPTLLDHFYTIAVNGFEKIASEAKYNVLIGQNQESLQREQELVSVMHSNRIDGLLIAISKETDNIDHLRKLERSGIPVVFFARKPVNESFSCVSSDVYHAATDAVSLFTAKGHHRIAFINGPSHWATSRDRFLGYRDGLLQHKIAIDQQLIEESDLSTPNNYQAIRRLMQLSSPPTAILLFKDYLMLDVMSCLRKEFPEQYPHIELIGYGALPLFSHFEKPPLASLKEQPFEIGEQAGALLLEMIQHPDQTFRPQLISLPCKLHHF
ncbi:LacI family DNA-binding transcriptional regulator [Olivibacter sp. SDN3]|uniref:LacI family DNA-binding transcriptional regulator n=1 Tax=Olivibacter sp. SDN3 TaxID=2764720 RepID=UPI001651100D|nr:LacI family DNA-binding transcriptional regulator [Olivibacter sp. SDN3]QNL50589.1 LacI family DNA-binding transcriptional regulator [Olivibacter sp. SDN3]